MDQARRYLIGNHRLGLQRLAGMAKHATLDELYGLGYDAWTRYESRVNAVTMDHIRQAIDRYITPTTCVEVLVGPDTVHGH